jgi:hypothetical protein
MRRLQVLGALALLLLLPATSWADKPPQPPGQQKQPDDGCLVVTGGNGVVTIWAQGGIIGRVGSGTVTIEDLSPSDPSKPKVFGWDSKIDLSKTRTQYVGSPDLRFRFTGGGPFHIVLNAVDIDLSVAGRGRALLNGAGIDQQGGSYSADASTLCAGDTKPFPDTPTKVVLGTPATG